MSIKLTKSGTILLNDIICCDGLYKEDTIRIQSHVHSDHLQGFQRSTQLQKIVLTEQSKALIMKIKNLPSLDSRPSIYSVNYNETIELNNYKITLVDSKHMLGAAQIVIEDQNGYRIGYSGDFNYPLEKCIEVDELFIDGTYGNPNSIRKDSMDDVIDQLCELITKNKLNKSFIISSHRGTLTHAMSFLHRYFPEIPFLVSKKFAKEIEVYNEYGYSLDNYFTQKDEEYFEIKEKNNYMNMVLTNEHHGGITPKNIAIDLKAIHGRERAITQTAPNSYTVAYSSHADFNGTIQYIENTGAKKVFTDTVKDANKAAQFASEIKTRLKVHAQPAEIVEG